MTATTAICKELNQQLTSHLTKGQLQQSQLDESKGRGEGGSMGGGGGQEVAPKFISLLLFML